MTECAPGSISDSPCPICSRLADREYATQKYGWPENDTHLPVAAGRLVIVRDPDPHASRGLSLRQCPHCGTFYLHRSDYEYLANGSEDEQTLTRLTPDEAAEYLQKLPPTP
jgi:hypothetical protein